MPPGLHLYLLLSNSGSLLASVFSRVQVFSCVVWLARCSLPSSFRPLSSRSVCAGQRRPDKDTDNASRQEDGVSTWISHNSLVCKSPKDSAMNAEIAGT